MASLGLVLIALAGMALIGYFAHQSYKKRIAAFNVLAAQHGWTFSTSDDGALTQSLPDLHPFDFGSSRRAREIVDGTWEGRSFQAFDYTCKTHSTDSKGRSTTTTHRFAVVMVSIPASFPDLVVAPENILSRFAGKVFNNDIAFEDEDFNRAFTVKSDDRKFASDVIHGPMMEMLKTEATDSEWMFTGNRVILFDKERLTPDMVVPDLTTLTRILSLVPDFVYADRG